MDPIRNTRNGPHLQGAAHPEEPPILSFSPKERRDGSPRFSLLDHKGIAAVAFGRPRNDK